MTAPHGPRTGRPPTRADRGAVSSPHVLASGAGLAVLRRGGSAVDAAIAVNTLLCVVYPHMAGLGGDGFWLIAGPDGPVQALNASGPAAATATRDWYAERGHTEQVPVRGALSALTVPGAVDGWRLAHERHGRLAWADLFDDAVHYARHGVPVSRSLSDWLVEDLELLSGEESTRQFVPDGRALREGDRLRQPELAASLEAIAAHGARAGFYEGDLGRRFCRALAVGGSPLRPDDLVAYHAQWEEPISTDYRGHTVYELRPNTQGFAALQILNLVEGFDVAAWGDGTPDYYHHLAEAVKLAFADRDEWLTDRHWVDIPLPSLLDKEYAARRRALIRPDRAMVMDEVEPGLRYSPQTHRRPPGGDTCAFTAVDRDGLAVSAIQSIYHDFGSAMIAGDTGIIPQNRGSFFSLDETHPNRMEPGKRTFHTLIPGLVCRDGRPWLAFGSMGGEGQPQTHAALLTRLIDFGYDVQQAIEAPRWLMGHTWGTTVKDLSLEGRIGDEVARELQRRRQPVRMLPNWDDNMGHAHAIRIDAERGLLEAGADPRGDGAALGY